MALFSAQEKLYFVFAGEGDRCYLDSMFQLDTNTYLWLELRESQFDNVYFVGLSNQKYSIRAIDDDSKLRYNAYSGRRFKMPTIRQGKNAVELEAEGLRKWIFEVLVKAAGQPTAVIFSLEAFSSLYGDNAGKKHLDKLIERPRNHNSVLIRAPMRLREEQHRLMIGPQSVFAHRSASGAAICPELVDMISEDHTVPMLEVLKQRLGGRFVELGAVTYARLQSMMRCVRFQRGAMWTDEQLLEYTNILYNWWYLSEITGTKELRSGFLHIWSNLFYEQRHRDDLYASLFEALCSSSGWKAFEDRAAVVRNDKNSETVKTFLYSLDRPTVEAKCHVSLANASLLDIAQIPWPEDIYRQIVKVNAAINVATKTEWTVMQASLLVPTNQAVPQQRVRSMEAYYRYFQTAMARKDYDTLCRAVNAMLFGGTYLYANESFFDYGLRFVQFERYLAASQDYFEIMSVDYSLLGGSPYEESSQMVYQAQRIKYKKYLDAMDTLLKASPQMSKDLDARDIESALTALDTMAEERCQTMEGSRTVDDAPMSVEEADAWLRSKNPTLRF